MSAQQHQRAIPVRAVIMILVFFAIAFAALGVHGFMTRDDDPNAALLAQADKLSAQASAAPSEAPAAPAACVFAETGATNAAKEVVAALGKAEVTVEGEVQPWRERPVPRDTVVYFDEGQEDAAKRVAAAVAEGTGTAARPAGVDACPGKLVVVVHK